MWPYRKVLVRSGLVMLAGILFSFLLPFLTQAMRFFDTKTPGDYQQRITDHARLQSFLTADTLQLLVSLLSAPFYLVIMCIYNWVIMPTTS